MKTSLNLAVLCVALAVGACAFVGCGSSSATADKMGSTDHMGGAMDDGKMGDKMAGDKMGDKMGMAAMNDKMEPMKMGDKMSDDKIADK